MSVRCFDLGIYLLAILPYSADSLRMERTPVSTRVKHPCQNPCQLHHEEQLDWQDQLDHPDHM